MLWPNCNCDATATLPRPKARPASAAPQSGASRRCPRSPAPASALKMRLFYVVTRNFLIHACMAATGRKLKSDPPRTGSASTEQRLFWLHEKGNSAEAYASLRELHVYRFQPTRRQFLRKNAYAAYADCAGTLFQPTRLRALQKKTNCSTSLVHQPVRKDQGKKSLDLPPR